jgi:hypothetical protein
LTDGGNGRTKNDGKMIPLLKELDKRDEYIKKDRKVISQVCV